MARDIPAVVREICLDLPRAEEFLSHGSPNFRVAKGRSFATLALNTHGDARIALWLRAPPGDQERYVAEDPEVYFVPPYVGPAGWLGLNLDRGLPWPEVVRQVREAWKTVASSRLLSELGAPIAVQPPECSVDPVDFDPLSVGLGRVLLERVRALALALPQSTEATQFGHPVWRVAGKRGFAVLHGDASGIRLQTWVGVDAQHLHTADPRFRIPPYMGHKGWISLALECEEPDWDEVRSLLRQSWCHFAPLKLQQTLRD